MLQQDRRPPALQARNDAGPAPEVQRQTGPASRRTLSTDDGRQTPLTRSVISLIGKSNASTPGKHVAGTMPSTPIYVPTSPHSHHVSSTRRASQRKAPGKSLKEPLDFVDLTGDDTSAEPRMDLNSPKVAHTQQNSQYLHRPTRPGSATNAGSGYAKRNNDKDMTRRTHSSSRTVTPVHERIVPGGPSYASNGDAVKQPNVPLQPRRDEPLDRSGNSPRSLSTVPWYTKGNTVVNVNQLSASPHRGSGSPSGSSSRHHSAEKTVMENGKREEQRSVSVNGHRPSPLGNQSANHARLDNNGREEPRFVSVNENHRNPQNGRNGDIGSGTARSPSRPRLKLNGPKNNNSAQQPQLPTGYTKTAANDMRGSHLKKPVPGEMTREAEVNHDKIFGFLPMQEPQTPITESDSSDADMTMKRSINRAFQMYSENSQARLLVEQDRQDGDSRITEAKILSYQNFEPVSGSGSTVLENHLQGVRRTNDTNVVSPETLGIEEAAAKPALELNTVSPTDNHRQGSSANRSPPIVQCTAIRTINGEPTFTVEPQQSAAGDDFSAQEPTTSSRRGSTPPDLKLLEAIFKPIVAEMKTDQEYLMAGFLSRARKDVTEWPGPVLDQSLPDPFSAVSPASKPQSLPSGPHHIRMEIKANRPGKPTLIEPQAIPFRPEAPKLPKYNSIVRLGSNVLTPNDKDLRYLPYFPAEEEKDGTDEVNYRRREELLEGFGNRIRFLPGERKCSEQADFWREHTEYFLEEVGCTCVDVMYYLLHDEDAEWKPQCQLSEEALSQWQNRETCCGTCGTKFEGDQWDRLAKRLSEQKPNEETLALAGLVCAVFSNMANFSIWHIVSTDAAVQSLLLGTEKRWRLEQGRKKPKQQALCMLCHMFDCPTHGAYLEDDHHSSSSSDEGDHHREKAGRHDHGTDHESDNESLDESEGRHNIRRHVALPQRNDPEEEGHTCGFFCVDPLTPLSDMLGLHKNGEIDGKYNKNIAKEFGDPGFEDDETCSDTCFWDVSNRSKHSVTDITQSESRTRFAGWDQRDITLYKSMLEACLKIRRGPCLIASMITRPCSVVFEEMLIDIHLVSNPVLEDVAGNQPSFAQTNGYKDKNYWFEHSDTFDHHKRRPFFPCSHSGPCHKNPDCTCWTDKVACEWMCGCDRACSRRFQGCRCLAKGAKVCFKDANCDCWVLNRECDPWLCGKCGVLEVLDPVNRHNDSILKGRCKNAMIQRNIPKRTLKSPSEVHGWGLFAGTDIRANEFIGEYKGEVISEEESNRRGLVYHYRGLEYLFQLNKEQEIDSSRAGNKIRFINNSERPSTINVYAQTMLCNGVQRIGLFAKRNLTAGEEMFFRYGYPESVTKNFWEKEDIYAGKRSSIGSVLEDEAENQATGIKAKGVKNSVVATREKKTKRRGGKRRVGKKIRTILQNPRGKERHSHFLDGLGHNESDLPQRLPKPMKRKRRSSPVIEESIFDLSETLPQKASLLPYDPEEEEAEEDDPFIGPSSSSIGGFHPEVAESASSDEEYHEDDPSSDCDSDSEAEELHSSSHSASDVDLEISDYEGIGSVNRRRSNATTSTRRSLPPTTASTSAPVSISKQLQNKRSLQTAAARVASMESRRRKAEEKRLRIRGGGDGAAEDKDTTTNDISDTGASFFAAAASLINTTNTLSAAMAGLASSSTSAPATPRGGGRRRRRKGVGKPVSGGDSDEKTATGTGGGSRTRTPYTGKKRGRPVGWKKGIHFK